MVGAGAVDGMVVGSICPTADTVRTGALWRGNHQGHQDGQQCSIMNTIIPEVGVDGSLVFADTGVVPEPTVEQLADIAVGGRPKCAGRCWASNRTWRC